MYGKKLEQVEVFKLLGVKLDQHLKFDSHIDYIYRKGCKRLGHLRFHMYNATIRLQLKPYTIFYTTIIRSVLEYASEIWNVASEETKKKLNLIQQKAVTTAYQLWPKTPQQICFTLSCLSPLEFRRREKQISMYHNALYYQVHQPSHLLNQAFLIHQKRQSNYFYRLGFAERPLSPFSQAIKYSKEMKIQPPTILPRNQPRPHLPPSKCRLLPFPPVCPFPTYNKVSLPQPTEEVILQSINPNNTLVIYTDGSVRPRNPGIGGYAFVVYKPGNPTPKQRLYIHNEIVTINKCELLALHEAICYCIRKWNERIRRIMIFSDNEPAVKFIKGFHCPKYKHFYLVQQIRQNILTKMKCTPEIYHIHAHQGYPVKKLSS